MTSNKMTNLINATHLEPFISQSRLASYATLTQAGSNLENLIYAYSWNKKIAAALYPVMQCLEITLRNAIHKNASVHFAQSDWYDALLKNVGDNTFTTQIRAGKMKPVFFRPGIVSRSGIASTRWFSRHENMLNEAKKKLQKTGKATTANNVVSNLMFGFWTELFESPYYSLTTKLLWPTLNAAVFPNLSGGDRTHSAIYNKLDALRLLRNRMSHHEPVWKNNNVTDAKSAISYLNQLFTDVIFLIQGMSKERLDLLTAIGAVDLFRTICNEEYLNTYISNNGIEKVDHRKITNEIRRHVSSKNVNSAVIKRAGRTVLLFD